MGLGFGMDFFAGLAEGKPTIPKFTPIDAQAEQLKSIQGNIAALPDAERLASQTNMFNQNELMKQLRNALPEYDSLVAGINSHINDQLAGNIPKDVQDQIQRSGAARALGGGYSGTGMHGNLVARDLGLTSLQLTQQGMDSASRWLTTVRNNFTAPMLDVSNMFISPQQQIGLAQSERDKEFQRDYVSNMNDWQHSTGYLWGQDMRNTGETIKSLLSSYMGGGMGGGGGASTSGGGGGGGGWYGGFGGSGHGGDAETSW